MLSDIFYFLGLLLFCITVSRVLTYSKIIDIKEWFEKFKKVTQKDPKKEDFRSEKEYSLFVSIGCFSVIENLWLICGLLTASWKIFGLLIILSFIFRLVFEKLSYTIQKIIGTLLTTIISALILLLVINHFHLHLDLFKVIFHH
jgi:hypothetical protein